MHTASPPPAFLVRQQQRQTLRLLCQIGFFVLFCIAPVFNLLRYDLEAGHAWLLGFAWHAGLDAFSRGEAGALETGVRIVLQVFLPILGAGLLLIGAAWRWGRLYCGWLCPHFSAVETINQLMRRATGKYSLWDAKPAPARQPNGQTVRYDARWWLLTVPLAVAFALCWAVVLLTYLLPPFEIYHNLFHASLTRNQQVFIGAGTLVLSLEFLFARHLFCRYACAVGLFQSLAWMANKDALVVGFTRPRAADCAQCYSACDHVCPMRLKPRNIKQLMFACTQCGQCMHACATTQAHNPAGPLLQWVSDEAARQNEAGFKGR
ncbi:MAG: 4Fe-4S binding protein [Zoogloea sp.]|uniref:4Fe-4S binding protein n=1 Tax=Zoogloea sp. TaxID=49181 RepID=UPI003F3A99D1